MLGDVVGEGGLDAVERVLPSLKAETGAVFVVANGENAAAGFGLSSATMERLLAAGVDVISSGNHIWEKRDFWPSLESDDRVIRPANYPDPAPGRGWTVKSAGGVTWTVINLQGREGMTAIDCPFRWIEQFRAAALSDAPEKEAAEKVAVKGRAASGVTETERAVTANIVLIDFHAESTQEKEALGLFADGWAGAFVGTHTHVATADERLLPAGTAYITDLGMTGVQTGVIGMDAAICLDRMKTAVPRRMECAAGLGELRGVLIDFDIESARAISIRRFARKAASL